MSARVSTSTVQASASATLSTTTVDVAHVSTNLSSATSVATVAAPYQVDALITVDTSKVPDLTSLKRVLDAILQAAQGTGIFTA